MYSRVLVMMAVSMTALEARAAPITPLLKDKYGGVNIEELFSGSRLTAGLIFNDSESFKLGEYNGVREESVYAQADFFTADQWTGADVTYKIEGSNLGLDSRHVEGEFAFPSGAELTFAYRELPHYNQEGLRTPFRLSGGNEWLLPDGWVGADTVSELTALNESLQEWNIRTKRRRLEANLSLPLNDRWSLAADYRLKRMEGRQLTGAVFGVGGSQMGVRLPSEVDRQLQDAGVSLTLAASWGTVTGGYRHSSHEEDSDPLVVQNPYINNAFADTANFPEGYARLSPPPDNSANVFYAKGVWRVTRRSRLSLDLRHTRHEQDDAFLPYTINSALATMPLPRTSLDGERVINHARLSLTLRPTARTDLALRYRFHDRDNRTERLSFAPVLNDVAAQGTDPATSDVRVNRPFSRKTRKFSVEGGYRLAGGWKVSAGLETEKQGLDFLPVDETDENAVHVKLNYRLNGALSGWVKWRRAERESGEYIHNAAYLAGHTEEFAEANGTDGFANDPALRQYFIADHDRDQLDLALNWTVTAATSLAFKLGNIDDDYPHSESGLRGVESHDLTVDITYSPRESLSLYGYASDNRHKRDQRGYQWLGFQPQSTLPPQRDDSANGWQVASTARSNTFGAGLEWSITPRLNADLEYARTLSETRYDLVAGSNLEAAPLPDLEMNWRDVTARARYQMRDNMTLSAQYRYRDYSNHDFALAGVSVDTGPSVLFSGARSPDFQGNTLVMSVVYDFQ